MTTRDWQRVARLDADAVVAQIEELAGVRLTVEGPCPGGEVGAAYVSWPDGRRSVLGYGTRRAAAHSAAARSAGVPAPDYQLVLDVAGGTAVVQERLPGTPPATVDRALVEQMLAVNARLSGLLAGSAGVPMVDLFLDRSGPGFCLHEPLRGHDRRTRRVLDWVLEVGRAHRLPDGDDLCHLDFHPGNTLVDGGRITGLVDWDGSCRGNRYLDLVTLRFDLAMRAPDLTGWLDGLLREAVPAGQLAPFWAHMSLRLVDWAIRHHGPAEVDLWLSVAALGPSIG